MSGELLLRAHLTQSGFLYVLGWTVSSALNRARPNLVPKGYKGAKRASRRPPIVGLLAVRQVSIRHKTWVGLCLVVAMVCVRPAFGQPRLSPQLVHVFGQSLYETLQPMFQHDIFSVDGTRSVCHEAAFVSPPPLVPGLPRAVRRNRSTPHVAASEDPNRCSRRTHFRAYAAPTSCR